MLTKEMKQAICSLALFNFIRMISADAPFDMIQEGFCYERFTYAGNDRIFLNWFTALPCTTGRPGDGAIDQAMLNCNLMVVYLDQYRDLKTQPIIEVEQISKDYLTVRRKILNLQRSWQKFMGRPAADFALGLGMQRPAPHPYKANNKTTKNAK